MANRNNTKTTRNNDTVVLTGRQGHGIASSRVEMPAYKADAAARFAQRQLAEIREQNSSRGW